MKFSNEFIAAMYRPFADPFKRPAKEKDVEVGYLNHRDMITARAMEPKLTLSAKLPKFSEPNPSGGSLTIYPNAFLTSKSFPNKQNSNAALWTWDGWRKKQLSTPP